MKTSKRIALETLDRVNKALEEYPNALTSTRAGDVNEHAAYIELVRESIELTNEQS